MLRKDVAGVRNPAFDVEAASNLRAFLTDQFEHRARLVPFLGELGRQGLPRLNTGGSRGRLLWLCLGGPLQSMLGYCSCVRKG